MCRRLCCVAITLIGGALSIGSVTAQSASGAPWSWGSNGDGELGNGTVTRYGGIATPGPVSDLNDVVQMAGGAMHTLALRADGTVWAWGNNSWGQLGQGEYSGTQATPVRVFGLGFTTAIAAGWAHSVALTADGTVWAWGYNVYGQVGDGTSGNNVLAPAPVAGLSGIVEIAVGHGGFTSMALKNDGTVWTWGYDGLGQLGNGTSNERPHPRPVTVANLSGVKAIGAGAQHGLAVRSDGTVWAWGSNTLGQLGAATRTTCSAFHDPCSPVPVRAKYLSGIVAVAGGGAFSLALRADGTMWGWGDNGYGQLGNGTITESGGVRIPVRTHINNVIAIDAGDSHSLALRSDGTIWTAGEDNLGQLGNGTFTDSSSPVAVSSVTGAIAIGAGQNHSLAIEP